MQVPDTQASEKRIRLSETGPHEKDEPWGEEFQGNSPLYISPTKDHHLWQVQIISHYSNLLAGFFIGSLHRVSFFKRKEGKGFFS